MFAGASAQDALTGAVESGLAVGAETDDRADRLDGGDALAFALLVAEPHGGWHQRHGVEIALGVPAVTAVW